ncbi:TPA: DegT/DnrJ/EryC1/StrS family aminotransferase [Candidatus Poribacteria bacterium]|nr:DegT/DnrJ/EryC1/StrS family aminotransferase [Candidatus Poribacteria bacterium]
MRVPLCRPLVGEEEVKAVAEVIRSGWLSTGPRTLEFERDFARYVGAKHGVATSSCTSALHLSLVASGVEEGDEVITSTFTYTATAEAIGYTGAKPVFADIDPVTLNILPEEIERRTTDRTKGVIPVHVAGHPCKMDEIYDIAGRFGLVVINDAAHAISTEIRGRRIGSMEHLNCFSFYATKNITTGEGGMITLNEDEIAEKLRLMRLHGIDRYTWARLQGERRWYYEVVERGFKYNMSDIQAAMGLCQLRKIDEIQRRRREIADRYNDAFSDVEEIITPPLPEDGKHSWHLYIIRLNLEMLSIDRDEFIRRMAERGIECSVHFIPLHLHPFYRKRYGYKAGDFPKAEEAYRQVVTLPLFSGMGDEEVDLVIDCALDIIRRYRR